ncbi:MAG: NADP-dependent phosphogluconate dehydrogenase [Candidatus Obscuribacterales bacterium]|nr:NADP-dependent phosphogluconate dehydrogenase [Candidatus Obscuribacterales bacterium]
MADKAQVGLIGLGVMGENLILNIERNGYTVAVYNRTTAKVDEFIAGRGKGKKFIGCDDPKTFIESIERPRKIVLLVKAGEAVDATINGFKQYLDKGDIIIDGGNSHFTDTMRREKQYAEEGFKFIGSGVSGGEEGALWGPSLMPGGDKEAYNEIKPIWEAIAAKVNDGPCVTYLGPNGAGHYVKMVHNGIEYGDMQLIAEVYDILRKALGMSASQIADLFEEWNKGILDSYLIEITSKVLSVIDPETGKPLVDLIKDKAGQKGTGKWTSQSALDLGIAIPTIDAALTARMLSALKDERMVAAKKLSGPQATVLTGDAAKRLKDSLQDALYASKVCSYAQGMALIKAGSDFYKWDVNLSECARIWKGGCIIRAALLEKIRAAFARQNDVPNLLVDPDFAAFMVKAQDNWRYAISTATNQGIAIPALSASLSYYDAYRCEHLPQNLTQAQRDFFGAHTYERVDKPDAGFVHTEWNQLIKEKAKK